MFRSILSLLFICMVSASAAPSAVMEQAEYLSRILKEADDAYYNRHQSIISDTAYDGLREQYDRLVQAYPDLTRIDCVGATVAADDKVEHSKRVLSLQKAYSDEEVDAFIDRCGTNLSYCVEPKIDGLTVLLMYRDGLLIQAVTRGDGKTGSDITEAILVSGCAPLQLKGAPVVLDIRGEVFMPLHAFNRLNERRGLVGKPPLKSPRNTAAGTVRLDDFSEVAERGLKLRVFELIETDVMPATHFDSLVLAKGCGLPVVESRRVQSGQVTETVSALNGVRSQMPFQTDGIVIKVDDRQCFQELGATSHHPRGALARKYKETPVETTLVNIEWSEGENGRLTPVAVFEPVEIGGATVERASLYNENHLKALGLKEGDRIQVIRAGGAVPEIVGKLRPF